MSLFVGWLKKAFLVICATLMTPNSLATQAPRTTNSFRRLLFTFTDSSHLPPPTNATHRVERRPVCNGTGTTNNVTVDRPYEPSLGICFNARASLVACFAQIAEAGDTLENSLLMG
ncbi:hypothetical protein TgHK011_009045 [Trichoderma gracile]|nr:hypothetical protein TgHK011_009045 [Trichoderma gracile]